MSEGANREVHPAVFVLDARGHPLDPCHPARARRLLAAGRAVVHRHTPFVIRLKDRDAATSAIEGVRVGIDPGSKHTGLPVSTASGGRTKWNRSRTGAAKSHTLDALHVGHLGGVTAWPSAVLVVKATGRGSYARTRTDRYGFPRLRLPRTKRVKGFATGDLVRAVVPSGKKAGVHLGRVAIRSTGSFNITTRHGLVQSIGHRHVRLLQRADGYGYTTHPETRHRAAFSSPPEGGGLHAGGI
ncbi:RRXRR domain-containing protein [Streptosporangium sp. CA-115845]|uniref:RRXRR domain-containing protein n=1 Tax=Streptosporangium sp. CA-115845 TaxID=3240071 RepID=UPI003D941924